MSMAPHFLIDGNPVVGFTGCGTFAEEMIIPEAAAIKVDDDIPLEVVSLVGCGVTTGVGAAINTADIRPGTSVVVLAPAASASPRSRVRGSPVRRRSSLWTWSTRSWRWPRSSEPPTR